ncbi:MAG: MFS transporter [Candidatus Hadarchaeales archaeon]
MKVPQALNLLANASIAMAGMLIPLLAKEFAPMLGVGLVIASFGLAAFISYSLFGRLSDVKRKRKIFLQVGLFSSGVIFLLQVFMVNFLSMIMIRARAGFSVGIFTFPLLAYVSEVEKTRAEIGKYVGFGSLGWGIGYFLAGILPSYAASFIFSGLLLLLAAGLSLSLKEAENFGQKILPLPHVLRQNLSTYTVFFTRQFGAQAVWAIFPVFLFQEFGASIFWIGIIHAVNTIAQFFILISVGRWGKKIEEEQFIRIGLLASSIVFFSYFFATSLFQLIPIQLLLASGYSMLYLGCVLRLLKSSTRGTSTGLLGSADALARVVGPPVAGVISQLIGMRMLMLFSAAVCLMALGLSRRTA